MSRPILLLEINEVPWRLIDRFSGKGFQAIDKFFAGSRTLTNVAVDSGHLSPWVTWPTFHRGVTKESHGIKALGQDPATFRGTPIWEEFRKRQYPIGVFGSMQSWPPIEPGAGGFYVPDTFAHDKACIPAFLEPLQSFNLRQTRTNKRVVERSSIFSKETVQLVQCLTCLRPRTIFSAGWQLVSEFGDRTRSSRRPVFQAALMWDAFQKVFDYANPPAFSTFFTNHVAGVMHRYWHDVFPEDFGKTRGDPAYVRTMEFALKVLDRILSTAIKYSLRNPNLILVFASSMGQEAIDRSHYEGMTLQLKDLRRLTECLQIDRQSYTQLLAMDPQTAIEVQDPNLRKQAARKLEACTTVSGKKLFTVLEHGASLSISISLPGKADIDAGRWKCGDSDWSWADGGIRILHVDPGSGYHVPEGAMAIYGAGIKPDHSRSVLRSDNAKDYLLELAGIDSAQYEMTGRQAHN
jgi:hypothetical protein